MSKNEIVLVISPCEICGMDMRISEARIEDDLQTGVIEIECPSCENTLIFMVVIEGRYTQ